MLRQLARLTRPVPAAGPNALAIAVYSGSGGRTIGARESGLEGVACVDDAARGLVLLSRLWVRTGNHELRRWALGLLDFVLWMHDGDGRWYNFIYDWEGSRNQDGLTSAPGPNFWQARAVEALTVAVLLFDPPPARIALKAGFAAAAASSPPADVRSVHAGAALELLRFEPEPWLSAELNRWCDEIAGCTADGMLMNSPDERGRPHLWGHTQEAVLIQAARSLERGELEGIARTSALAVFGEAIESGFDLPHVQPYDVQSAVEVMSRLHSETGDGEFGTCARQAREWFGGRNPAHRPVYMRDAGRVADGVDDGTINEHSGAEANIAAGLALIDDGFVRALAAAWPKPAWDPR